MSVLVLFRFVIVDGKTNSWDRKCLLYLQCWTWQIKNVTKMSTYKIIFQASLKWHSCFAWFINYSCMRYAESSFAWNMFLNQYMKHVSKTNIRYFHQDFVSYVIFFMTVNESFLMWAYSSLTVWAFLVFKVWKMQNQDLLLSFQRILPQSN